MSMSMYLSACHFIHLVCLVYLPRKSRILGVDSPVVETERRQSDMFEAFLCFLVAFQNEVEVEVATQQADGEDRSAN